MRKIISEKGAVEEAVLYLRVSISDHFTLLDQILAQNDVLTFATLICFCRAMTEASIGVIKKKMKKKVCSLAFFFASFLILLLECFL